MLLYDVPRNSFSRGTGHFRQGHSSMVIVVCALAAILIAAIPLFSPGAVAQPIDPILSSPRCLFQTRSTIMQSLMLFVSVLSPLGNHLADTAHAGPAGLWIGSRMAP